MAGLKGEGGEIGDGEGAVDEFAAMGALHRVLDGFAAEEEETEAGGEGLLGRGGGDGGRGRIHREGSAEYVRDLGVGKPLGTTD